MPQEPTFGCALAHSARAGVIASAAKRPRSRPAALDCFAPLAMTGKR
jgi:hypothetical protein